MQVLWSKVIETFAPKFGISKGQIEDAYNKPDRSDVIGGTYISVKFYTGHALIITFFMDRDRVHFMNAYKIFPDMLSVDVSKAGALQILQDFMDRFGVETDVPGVGKVRMHVDEANRRFFQGILDVERYFAAADGRL